MLDLTEPLLPPDPSVPRRLTWEVLDWCASQYVGAAQRRDPTVSPALASSFADLPPTLIITGERDIVRKPVDRYLEGLTEAGVATIALLYSGMPHAFGSLDRSPTARHAIDAVAAFLEQSTASR